MLIELDDCLVLMNINRIQVFFFFFFFFFFIKEYFQSVYVKN